MVLVVRPDKVIYKVPVLVAGISPISEMKLASRAGPAVLEPAVPP
jgi:hypothetical protein